MIDTKETHDKEDARHYRVIGSRPIRHDGVDKVTGRAVYGADVRPAGLLRGKVLRSPYAHARIVRIDTSKAAALPGVKAVVTAADLPDLADKVEDLGEGAVNLRELSHNVLAAGKVLYHGHPVAAVAAIDDRVAEQAARLIEVEYEPLPLVLDVRAAMEPDAPLLDESRRTTSLGQEADAPSNVAGHLRFELGSVADGFARADVVVEHEYRTTMVHQGYIEPQTATAL
ncbi:MAG: xanthine dehydrogenase family protein molybdopterin-binding subunit, partial [Chloroflexota bacterium]